MDNQKFIDGSWYDQEYLEGWYRQLYITTPIPQWAKECKAYYINRILMYLDLPLSAKILDLGAGVGQGMRAWQERGFQNVHGIEISQIAVVHSGIYTLRQGTVQNMPYKDKEFDLVFSSALLEHIDESILEDVLKECFRVGVMQAHTLCLDKGTDPSHINMKSKQEWLEAFQGHTKDLVFVGADELLLTGPILVVVSKERLTYPLRTYFQNAANNNHK